MPRSLLPVPAPSQPFDLTLLEDWVIAAWIVDLRQFSLDSWGPSVRQLSGVSGRNFRRVKDSLERLRERGWIGFVKLAYEWHPGQWGHRHKIWLTHNSPLLELERSSKTPFVLVPVSVAKFRSPLAVAVYLVMHEQQRVDGAIAITPTELAGLLHCHRSTARRLLRFCGAEAVTESRPNRCVYMLRNRRLAHPGVGFTWRGLEFIGPDASSSVNRLDLIAQALERGGVDAEAAIAEVHADVAERLGDLMGPGDVPVKVAIRVLEELHTRELGRDQLYRPKLLRRLARRYRYLVPSPAAFTVRSARDADEREQMRRDIEQLMAPQCPTCRGNGMILWTDDRGYSMSADCPECRSTV